MDHSRLMRFLYPAGAIFATLLAVGYAVDSEWWRVGAHALIAVWFGFETLRSRRRGGSENAEPAAAGCWSPEQVRQTLAEVDGDEVRAIREVRRVSPDLSLREAADLVRAEVDQPR